MLPEWLLNALAGLPLSSSSSLIAPAATTYATWWMPYAEPKPSRFDPRRGWVPVGLDETALRAQDNVQSLGVVGRGRTPQIVGGEHVNYRQPRFRTALFRAARDAGVTVMIADCTNGFHGSEIARLTPGILGPALDELRALGMQCAVAVGSRGRAPPGGKNAGKDLAALELEGARALLERAGDTWFRVRGKPVIVLFADFAKAAAHYRAQPGGAAFEYVPCGADDCSGGGGQPGVWGWQLGPRCGTARSPDAVYVTPSVKFFRDDLTAAAYNAKFGTTHAAWRGTKVIKGHDKHRSAAWLDWNFAVAAAARPAVVVVGGIDDLAERNGWGPFETAALEPGARTYDVAGAVTATGLYDRVKAWTATGRMPPPAAPGGPVADGFYALHHPARGWLWVPGNETRAAPPAGNPAAWSAGQPPGLSGTFALYHVGGGAYRVVAVNGLALTKTAAGKLVQDMHSTERTQWFRIKPAAGAGLLTVSGIGDVRLVPRAPK